MVVTAGRDAHTQERAYLFIKKISSSITLEWFISNQLIVKTMSLTYQRLISQCDQSIYADLMDYDTKNNTSSATNNAN